ncbi:DedA family protein [Alicyclobacillus dauci]|uniref:DedA family protein n=1 Tax=Alicyclobacillus dauci TaxID=1475485 RepID=A0ABY6YXT4_9BACL|nr:DedA family protein [Alicyclobacillus dauci]
MAEHWVHSGGYIGVFVAMLLESACIPIPSEVIMPLGGYLAFAGHLNLWMVIIMGTLGNVVGSLIAYFVGSYGGRPLLNRYGKYVRLSERHLQLAEVWFARRGAWAVFVGRLLPAIRTFISLPAGIGKMPLGRFTLLTALGSLPWVAVLSFAGFKLGQNSSTIQHDMHLLTYLAIILVVAFVVYVWSRRKNNLH